MQYYYLSYFYFVCAPFNTRRKGRSYNSTDRRLAELLPVDPSIALWDPLGLFTC